MSLLKSLRQNITPARNILTSSTLRGPKKKSDKKGDGIVTEHLLNIYKNTEDVPILPSEYYPKWVIGMKEHPLTMEEYIINSYCGNYVNNKQIIIIILIKYFSSLIIQNFILCLSIEEDS